MWSTETERKKPPLVPASEKPQTTMVSAELEALRQRGLAKILNKHFTETTRKLATEKAAAEAAMRDLQQRQDNQPSDGALDSLFMSVQQWRNECRQKERETLLLFQRYVEKFGFTGQVSAPDMASSNGPAAWQGTTNPNAPPSPAVSAKLAAPPPHNTPLPAVPNITAAIEEQLEEYIKNGAISFPSLELLGIEETFQGVHSKEEAEFRNFYRRQLEDRGVDVKAPSYNVGSDGKFIYQGPTFVRQQQEEEDHGYNIMDSFARPTSRNDVEDEEEDSDDVLGDLMVREAHALDTDSVVSGLTSINSAVTREVLHECERSVAEFLKVEQEAIRQVMTAEEDAVTTQSSSAQSEIGSATKRAADQAETMAKQMQDILNDFNKQKLEQKHLLEGRPYETSNPDEKWMIYYDETYKREYYHELNTNRTQWEPPEQQQQDVESTMNHSSSQFMYDEVMPELSSPNAISRIAMYRRRKRKERKRRLMVLAVLTVTFIAGSAIYMYQKHSFKAEQLRLQQQQALAEEEARAAAEAAAAARAARERALMEARLRAERERIERERREQERLALEAQRAREEAERLEREQQQLQEKNVLNRPWGCNIPLAYIVHGYCRRLANDNPVFDLHSLVSSMMQ